MSGAKIDRVGETVFITGTSEVYTGPSTGIYFDSVGCSNLIIGISRPVWTKPTARPRVESVRERKARFLREANIEVEEYTSL